MSQPQGAGTLPGVLASIVASKEAVVERLRARAGELEAAARSGVQRVPARVAVVDLLAGTFAVDGVVRQVGPVGLLVLGQEAVDALDLGGEVALCQVGEDARHFDQGNDVIAVL